MVNVVRCPECGAQIGLLGDGPVQDAVTEAKALIHRLECGSVEMKGMAEADLMAASNMWRHRAIMKAAIDNEELPWGGHL